MIFRITTAVLILISCNLFAQQPTTTTEFLPIELSVERSENTVSVSWTTDQSYDILILERSTNNKHFELVEVIYPDRKITSNGDFKTADPTPEAGLNYYRLKYASTDEPDQYSKSVSVFYNYKVSEVTISPNSVLKQALIKIRPSGESEFSVLDETGEPLKRYKLSLPANAEHLLDLQKLPKGKYYIQVINNEKKFLKQIIL